MVVATVDVVKETVAVAPRPSFTETTVYSLLEFAGHRRHKEEVTFRPHLSPVKYADTVFVYLNNTRKRYVSKTFYEPRVKPSSFSETTYANPKTTREVFVTYLDQTAEEKRKWFKTAVEIKARRYRSAHVLPSPTDINSNSLSAVDRTLVEQRLRTRMNGGHDDRRDDEQHAHQNGDRHSLLGSGRFEEVYDPGASQVFIPIRKNQPLLSLSPDQQQIFEDFPNGNVNLNFRTDGSLDDYSDV